MPDPAKNEPALTAEEWSNGIVDRGPLYLSLEGMTLRDHERLLRGDNSVPLRFVVGDSSILTKFWFGSPQALAAAIALANAALPQHDPRKLTRAHVELLCAVECSVASTVPDLLPPDDTPAFELVQRVRARGDIVGQLHALHSLITSLLDPSDA